MSSPAIVTVILSLFKAKIVLQSSGVVSTDLQDVLDVRVKGPGVTTFFNFESGVSHCQER